MENIFIKNLMNYKSRVTLQLHIHSTYQRCRENQKTLKLINLMINGSWKDIIFLFAMFVRSSNRFPNLKFFFRNFLIYSTHRFIKYLISQTLTRSIYIFYLFYLGGLKIEKMCISAVNANSGQVRLYNSQKDIQSKVCTKCQLSASTNKSWDLIIPNHIKYSWGCLPWFSLSYEKPLYIRVSMEKY